MNCALVENGVVTNIIWMYRVTDLPGAIECGEVPVGIGDTYDGEYFYRDGERLYTPYEQLENESADLAEELINTQIQLAMYEIEFGDTMDLDFLDLF